MMFHIIMWCLITIIGTCLACGYFYDRKEGTGWGFLILSATLVIFGGFIAASEDGSPRNANRLPTDTVLHVKSIVVYDGATHVTLHKATDPGASLLFYRLEDQLPVTAGKCMIVRDNGKMESANCP